MLFLRLRRWPNINPALVNGHGHVNPLLDCQGTTATSPITIATSDRDQQENGYEGNSLTSQSLSPLPSELTHSMNMGLEEGIGDFPDTAAPYAQMEEDLEETEEDVSLGQDLVEDDNMVDESPNDPIKYFTTSITADDEDDDVIAGCNVVITESEDVDKFAEEKQPAEYVDDGSSDLAIHVTEPSSEEEENDSDHEAENPDDDAIKSPDADLDKSPDEAREADDIDDTAVTRDTADTDTVTDTADTQVAMESDDPVPDVSTVHGSSMYSRTPPIDNGYGFLMSSGFFYFSLGA